VCNTIPIKKKSKKHVTIDKFERSTSVEGVKYYSTIHPSGHCPPLSEPEFCVCATEFFHPAFLAPLHVDTTYSVPPTSMVILK
jgi:hypothetical protein